MQRAFETPVFKQSFADEAIHRLHSFAEKACKTYGFKHSFAEEACETRAFKCSKRVNHMFLKTLSLRKLVKQMLFNATCS